MLKHVYMPSAKKVCYFMYELIFLIRKMRIREMSERSSQVFVVAGEQM